MDWKGVEERIVQDDQNKWDQKVSSSQLHVTRSGALELTDGPGLTGCYSLSDLATGQMCQRLGIPVGYYRRLPGEMKAQVANYDLRRLEDRSYLLRGKESLIRGFLSTEYVAYNNSQIAETVHALLGSAQVSVRAFVLEETHMFLKIISEEVVEPASGLKGGVVISNSEVGAASILVEPFVFRLPCTNDLIVSQEKTFRHAHTHLAAHELNHRMADGISEAFKVASSIMDKFLENQKEEVGDPIEAIQELAMARKLSRKFTDRVIDFYLAVLSRLARHF